MRSLPYFLLLLAFAAMTTPVRADDADDLVKKARAALKKGNAAEALAAASKAVELAPKNPVALFTRGEAYEAMRKHDEAIRDFDRVIELDPKFALAYDRRGSERFKLGKIKESIEDFDKFLALRPDALPSHWKRGISYYYAGRFGDGAKQFKAGEVVFGDDVENAFWHYLCNARLEGAEKARAKLLKVGPDKRVPMMKVYDLIAGKAKPADVIATAENAKLKGEDREEALFYAHLYVALSYEAEGDAKKCREHLAEAVEKHKIGHYMWDVGNVHLQLLRKKGKD